MTLMMMMMMIISLIILNTVNFKIIRIINTKLPHFSISNSINIQIMNESLTKIPTNATPIDVVANQLIAHTFVTIIAPYLDNTNVNYYSIDSIAAKVVIFLSQCTDNSHLYDMIYPNTIPYLTIFDSDDTVQLNLYHLNSVILFFIISNHCVWIYCVLWIKFNYHSLSIIRYSLLSYTCTIVPSLDLCEIVTTLQPQLDLCEAISAIQLHLDLCEAINSFSTQRNCRVPVYQPTF